MRSFRLIVEYDGSRFHGWQAQAGLRTVEGELRAALARSCGGAVETAGASRTDTGVHARGQCALVRVDTALEPGALGRALEALTPADLGIVECREAAADFHPRHSALEKRYLYRVYSARRAPVFERGYEWWVRAPLDLERMRAAAHALEGTHDFSAFQNRSKDPPESPVRSLRAIDCQQVGDRFVVQVIGDGFLYRMVRNITGTLVEIGRGKLAPAECAAILSSRDRGHAGPCAPPNGLYLMEVAYPDTSPCTVEDFRSSPRGAGWR